MHVHGPGRLHVLKSTKWSARFCFTKTLYNVYRLRFPLDSVQYRLKANAFFFTHLMSEIKKNYFVTACSNQITPKIILPLMLSINRKAWKNRPMLKMFWILPLAENTKKIFFSDYKYFTKLVLQLSHFPENESWFPRVFCSKRLTCYPSYFMQ